MRHLATILLLSLPMSAAAHDLWLEKEAGGYVLFQGHRHASHAGAKNVPYKPSAVTSATCLNTDGVSTSITPWKAHPVKFPGECAALLVSFSTGYWTKTPWETKNVPKTGITGVLKSWLSEHSVKRIDRWMSGSAKPISSGLEIVPLSDPGKVVIGDTLVVLVTDNKTPKAGVPVSYLGSTRGTTGDDGKFAIQIRRRGFQLISASIEAPLNDGKADIAIRSTALQFEVPK